MLFKLFLMDLTLEKRKEFLKAHGCWDVDVEDPSTFPNDWDITPIMVFDTDEVEDLEVKFHVVKAGDVPVIAGSFDTLEGAKAYRDYMETCFPFYNFYIRSNGDVEINGNLF